MLHVRKFDSYWISLSFPSTRNPVSRISRQMRLSAGICLFVRSWCIFHVLPEITLPPPPREEQVRSVRPKCFTHSGNCVRSRSSLLPERDGVIFARRWRHRTKGFHAISRRIFPVWNNFLPAIVTRTRIKLELWLSNNPRDRRSSPGSAQKSRRETEEPSHPKT